MKDLCFFRLLACFLFLPLVLLQAGPASDSDLSSAKPDKWKYNLFNPTPGAEMRDFSPDRPNLTDGPLTLDAGHLQIESGILTYSRDRYTSDLTRLDQFDFAQLNFRIGLLNNLEFDAIFTSYTYARSKNKSTGERQIQRGFGDLTLRAKINLIGNEGGLFALGLIPFLNLPTANDGLGDGGFEGGLGLPFQFNLPAGWTLGAETTFSLLRGESGWHWEYVNSISLGHDLIKKVSAYVEYFSQISTEAHQGVVGSVDGGLVYQMFDNFEIDGGVNVGVTKAAADLQPFVGASWRF